MRAGTMCCLSRVMCKLSGQSIPKSVLGDAPKGFVCLSSCFQCNTKYKSTSTCPAFAIWRVGPFTACPEQEAESMLAHLPSSLPV